MRWFSVYDLSKGSWRAGHSHKKCEQFIILIRGEINIVLDDGQNKFDLRLNKPSLALHVKPFIWDFFYGQSEDATLMVFASDLYDSHDYIDSYEEFLQLTNTN